jgi:hypothetical protein
MSLPSNELVELFANNKVATLNAVGLLLIIGVLLLFKRQHRYDWWSWGGLVFILVGTVCQIMANRV